MHPTNMKLNMSTNLEKLSDAIMSYKVKQTQKGGLQLTTIKVCLKVPG